MVNVFKIEPKKIEKIISDYYWRDYNGTIPNDAIEGGTDENGDVTYIGQTFFPVENVLFITTIKRGSKYAYSDWDGPIKSDKFTKVSRICKRFFKYFIL